MNAWTAPNEDTSFFEEWAFLVIPALAYGALTIARVRPARLRVRPSLQRVNVSGLLPASTGGGGVLAAGVAMVGAIAALWRYGRAIAAITILLDAPACRLHSGFSARELGMDWAPRSIVFSVHSATYDVWRGRWVLRCEQKSHAHSTADGRVRYKRFVSDRCAVHTAEFTLCVPRSTLHKLAGTPWRVKV